MDGGGPYIPKFYWTFLKHKQVFIALQVSIWLLISSFWIGNNTHTPGQILNWYHSKSLPEEGTILTPKRHEGACYMLMGGRVYSQSHKNLAAVHKSTAGSSRHIEKGGQAIHVWGSQQSRNILLFISFYVAREWCARSRIFYISLRAKAEAKRENLSELHWRADIPVFGLHPWQWRLFFMFVWGVLGKTLPTSHFSKP